MKMQLGSLEKILISSPANDAKNLEKWQKPWNTDTDIFISTQREISNEYQHDRVGFSVEK